MPLLLSSDKDLIRLNLPAEGEWVEVKKTLGKDDEREISRRILGASNVTAGQIEDRNYDLGKLTDAANFAIAEVAIKHWSFKYAITPRNIRALDDDSLAFLIAKFDEIYPKARSDEDRADFSEPSAPPSTAEAAGPPPSAGSS